MCLVKNESDIIGQTLKAATDWCDFIYVYDNGSDDTTWEQVWDLSKDCPQIVPYKREDKPFRDSLRAEIFNTYRKRARQGDWWCRLDADEFYIDNPRVFLGQVPGKYTVVWSASLSYYFTDRDLERFRQDPSLYADDVPVEQKCRYYINHWSEPRFFRYEHNIVWENGGYPARMSWARVYPARIRLKHFPYRSPQQIDKRLRTRQPATTDGQFLHEAIPNWAELIGRIRDDPMTGLTSSHKEHVAATWEERIVDASTLEYDAHDGRYVINDHLMPVIPGRSSIIRKFVFAFIVRLKSAGRSWLRRGNANEAANGADGESPQPGRTGTRRLGT
jgi:hypothetical protein